MQSYQVTDYEPSLAGMAAFDRIDPGVSMVAYLIAQSSRETTAKLAQ